MMTSIKKRVHVIVKDRVNDPLSKSNPFSSTIEIVVGYTSKSLDM